MESVNSLNPVKIALSGRAAAVWRPRRQAVASALKEEEKAPAGRERSIGGECSVKMTMPAPPSVQPSVADPSVQMWTSAGGRPAIVSRAAALREAAGPVLLVTSQRSVWKTTPEVSDQGGGGGLFGSRWRSVRPTLEETVIATLRQDLRKPPSPPWARMRGVT